MFAACASMVYGVLVCSPHISPNARNVDAAQGSQIIGLYSQILKPPTYKKIFSELLLMFSCVSQLQSWEFRRKTLFDPR